MCCMRENTVAISHRPETRWLQPLSGILTAVVAMAITYCTGHGGAGGIPSPDVSGAVQSCKKETGDLL